MEDRIIEFLPVVGTGPKRPKIAIVGEAPGEQEEREGKPFCGPAGRLLDKLLSAVGIVRSEVYITNVVKERPIRNNISEFLTFSRRETNETEEFKIYKELLKRELEEIKPNVVVAMGNVALWALCEERDITKRRGSILESTLVQGLKVIPTIHPASALREFMFERYIAFDLKRAKEESESPKITLPRRVFHLFPTFKDTLAYLDHARKQDLIAFDIEVISRMEVSCISIATDPNEAMTIPFLSKGENYFDPLQEAEVWLAIADLLQDQKVEKLAHNAVFDFSFLYRKYGIRIRPIHCSMVAQALVSMDYPKSLDFITSIYTKEPYYKDDGKIWNKITYDEETFFKYCARDSMCAYEAFLKLIPELKRIGNYDSYKQTIELIEPLVEMQERGILMDTEYLRQKAGESDQQIVDLFVQLQTLIAQKTGIVIDERFMNSPKQISDYFYKELNLKPLYKRDRETDQWKPTTDKDALKRLAIRGVQEAKLLAEIKQLYKLNSTYYKLYKRMPDGRMRCSYNPVGSKNGRLSSSRNIFGDGSNLQNLPPPMKQAMLPDEGYFLINIDLSQAENRIVAVIAPEPLLEDAFIKGKDVHKRTAGLLFNKPEEEISDEPGSSPLGDGTKSERFWGKQCNHALNYGLGYKKFSLRLEIPENQGKMLVERYHEAYPGIRNNFHRWVQESLRATRSITDPFGKKRIFLERWGDELFKSAYSYVPQSTVAYVINNWGLKKIYYESPFRDYQILNQVHDSILMQHKIPKKPWEFQSLCITLRMIVRSLEQPIPWQVRTFVIPAEVKIGLCGNEKKMFTIDTSSEDSISRSLDEAFGKMS